MQNKITKTSRILSVFHLFLNCEEVSFQELEHQLRLRKRTAYRDIRLLRQAGVLQVRFDRTRNAYVPVCLDPFPMEPQSNRTHQKYLEKLRRLCVLMQRMAQEDDHDGTNRVVLYREILPGVSDRTRQRDFAELKKLGYEAWYEREFDDEPGRWYYRIPGTYGLKTFHENPMKWEVRSCT